MQEFWLFHQWKLNKTNNKGDFHFFVRCNANLARFTFHLWKVWGLESAKNDIKCELKSLHSFWVFINIAVILLYLSIPHAFYFSFNTYCTIPATVCPRQALIIYCLLIKCSTMFDHFSSVNLHNTNWRLTSSVHWWFPNHLKSAKSFFCAARYSFVWNISVPFMKLLRMI